MEKSNKRSESVAQRGGELFDSVKMKVPDKYKKYADYIRPAVMALLVLIDLVLPHLPKVWDAIKWCYVKLLPVWDELQLVWGLILTFFGGSFTVTITAVEAFRLVGKDKIMAAWYKIEDDVHRVVDEYGKEKENNKGLSADQWMQKNGHMLLRIVDPEDCRSALIGFYAGATAVMACLRTRFAQVIALGVSVGEVLEQHVGLQVINPIVKALVPEEHWKWVPLIVQCVCRIPTVLLAWFLQRMLSAYHSALRGGNIIASSFLSFLLKRGFIAEEPSDQVRSGCTAAFAFLGFMFQLSHGFGLPWLLGIVLFPFTVVEYTLSLVTLGI